MLIHRTIYEKLAGAFSEEQQAIYQQRVDEIAPNLRYCAYNIGDESALEDLQKMRVAAGGDQLSSKLDVSQFTNRAFLSDLRALTISRFERGLRGLWGGVAPFIACQLGIRRLGCR